MATNLDIDQALLAKAVKAGAHKTKREAVNQALLEYVRRHGQARIVELFGKIHFDPKYDYKAGRRAR